MATHPPSGFVLADIRLAQYSVEACFALALSIRTKLLLGLSILLHTGTRVPLSAGADCREAWTQEPSIWLPTQGVAVTVAELTLELLGVEVVDVLDSDLEMMF